MMKVSLETVQEVARVLRESSLAEIDIAGTGEDGKGRLRLRRAVVFVPAPSSAAAAAASPVAPAASNRADESKSAASTEPDASPNLTVRAMSVGIYHLPPNGLEAGEAVQAGQTIGIIESLNIPSELFAPAAGRITEFLVEEGQGVEYNQPLVEIEPLAASPA